MEKKKRAEAQAEVRSLSHGTGDRSDKIRTYNFPQGRVTDHRAGITIAGVDRVLNGEQLLPILNKLEEYDEMRRISKLVEEIQG